MKRTGRAARALPRVLVTVAIAAGVVLAGTAQTIAEPRTTAGNAALASVPTVSVTPIFFTDPEPGGTPSDVAPTATAPSTSTAPLPTPSVTPSATPTATPTPTPPTPAPADPWDGVSAKTKKAFKPCLPRTVGPGSSGSCARLVLAGLKRAGYFPWRNNGVVTAAGVNAMLNYQRSRGLKATGTTTKATWMALATKAPILPTVLPDKCSAKGVVLCVDQAHRKLFFLKNGKVVKTFKVRLGGYNVHPKTKKWRVFPTANGTWKVYDKQVDPKSENYGSGAMPYSTIFYPDMYVHYSPGFHSVGYAGSSHGCVNIGNIAQARWIFSHTPIGARVHIFSPMAD